MIKNTANNQRGSLGIIFGVIILLLIIGGGAYLLGSRQTTTTPLPLQSESMLPSSSPTSTLAPLRGDIADWNTYTNTKFGFSMRYPTDYKTSCEADSDDCSFNNYIGPGIGPTNFVWVSVTPVDPSKRTDTIYNASGLDILPTLKPNESQTLDKGGTVYSKYTIYKRLDDVLIDGANAKVFENQNPWEFPHGTVETRIYLVRNGNYYIFGAYTGAVELSQELFNKIVSTIKFSN